MQQADDTDSDDTYDIRAILLLNNQDKDSSWILFQGPENGNLHNMQIYQMQRYLKHTIGESF